MPSENRLENYSNQKDTVSYPVTSLSTLTDALPMVCTIEPATALRCPHPFVWKGLKIVKDSGLAVINTSSYADFWQCTTDTVGSNYGTSAVVFAIIVALFSISVLALVSYRLYIIWAFDLKETAGRSKLVSLCVHPVGQP